MPLHPHEGFHSRPSIRLPCDCSHPTMGTSGSREDHPAGPQLNPPRPPKTQVSTREMEPGSHIRKPPYCAWRQSLNPGTEKNKSADSISPSAGSQSWYFPWDKEEQRGPSPMPSVHGLPANPAHLLYHCLPHYRGHYVFSAFVLGQVP